MAAPKGNKNAVGNKGGAPTKYNSEYCQMVIAHMAKGLSFESFAGFIGVAKDTIYGWAENHIEFSDAKTIGFEKNRMFWEKAGIQLATSGKGNAAAFIFNMKNRFPKDWRDKQETGFTDKDGNDIKPTIQLIPAPNCEPLKED